MVKILKETDRWKSHQAFQATWWWSTKHSLWSSSPPNKSLTLRRHQQRDRASTAPCSSLHQGCLRKIKLNALRRTATLLSTTPEKSFLWRTKSHKCLSQGLPSLKAPQVRSNTLSSSWRSSLSTQWTSRPKVRCSMTIWWESSMTVMTQITLIMSHLLNCQRSMRTQRIHSTRVEAPSILWSKTSSQWSNQSNSDQSSPKTQCGLHQQ